MRYVTTFFVGATFCDIVPALKCLQAADDVSVEELNEARSRLTDEAFAFSIFLNTGRTGMELLSTLEKFILQKCLDGNVLRNLAETKLPALAFRENGSLDEQQASLFNHRKQILSFEFSLRVGVSSFAFVVCD